MITFETVIKTTRGFTLPKKRNDENCKGKSRNKKSVN